MTVKIKNSLVSGPVAIPLTNGQSLRLSPGEESRELPDIEATGNAKVDKLRRLRVIEVVVTESATGDSDAETAEAAEGATATPAPARKSTRSRSTE
jgi:hypothetical protein